MSESPRRIVVVGSLNMDLVVRAPHHPQPGETILGDEFRTFPGGKGANQAVAAARLGARVSLVGRVGQDDFGTALLETLARDGVDAAAVRRDAAATGVALITVDAAGQNTIVVAAGANGQVSPADVDAAAPLFTNAAVVLLQLEIPLATVRHTLTVARQHAVPVVLNPAPAQPLPAELLAGVEVLIPNQTELAQLTGEAEIEAGARRLLAAGVRNIVVTLGADGVLGLTAAGERFHHPAQAVKVVDTTAAGDAFVGAFATALAEGRPLPEAAAWGNAAGALAVTRAGAQPSLPSRAEFLAFLR
ncbi:MAG: ribokinase [Anaerolineales bacterium]|nr:ribokinase [Anaerolineales bacterium]